MSTLKKTTTKTAKAAPMTESLEESVAHEVKRPPVQQVVEVLEETSESPAEESTGAVGEVTKGRTIEDLMQERAPKTEQSIEEPLEETAAPADVVPDKKKVVVDELFAERESPDREKDVMPEISIHKKRGAKPVVIWAFVMVLITLGISFAIITATGNSNMLPFVVPLSTPTPTPTGTPTPTPSPAELPKDAITIQVLNGGGVSGAASKIKALLEEKGYTVSDTGNTEEYSYEQTEILVKEASAAYLPQLEKDLGESYVIGTSAATLEDEAEYDVRVTVGKE